MADDLVPREALESLVLVENELATLEQQLHTILSLLTQETLALLSPLEQASTFLCLSKTVNALFCLHLRCKGISPDDHFSSSEVERVTLYEDKIGHFMDRDKGPKCPSSSLDIQAASRFIEHAIPDLTEEQKKGIRDISRGASMQSHESKHSARKSRNLPARPIKPIRTETITEAVTAFLDEAKKELLEA